MSAGPGRFWLLAVLGVGMVSISFGSILVKWAHEAPSLTIAFYRMATATALLTPFYGFGRMSKGVHRRSVGSIFSLRSALAGMALALHFAFWVSSLRFTSVAVSTLLVTTSPVLVAMIAYLFLGERTSARAIAGITVSFLGASLLSWGDLQLGDWRGSALAMAGAVAIAVYWVVGRRARPGQGLVEYIYPVYFSAAVILGLVVLAAGLPVRGFSTATWAALLLAGVVPQSLGHSAYNWALAYLPATTVSTLVLAEPILASLLAYWLLDEVLGGLVLLGGGLVAAGILMVSLWGRPRNEPLARTPNAT